MEYDFRQIEKKWQQIWEEKEVYKTPNHSSKPKFYVLDMFPYPSGAGLHVGHPLGYIASDIVARFKRLKGFNVLHPMGFDSFGLPAEQYAIQTGQHPALTTEENINTFKKQLRNIGFSYDWSRELRTSSPDFYQWTQWIFIQLFHSYYDKNLGKAQPIQKLTEHFEQSGTQNLNAHAEEKTPQFSAKQWKKFSEKEQQQILLHYRLAYLDEMTVNWCPALGTVLANDEVKDGVSERGGYPVVRKQMQQWAMRITAYAERLREGLEEIDWSDALKEMQRNWIGKSLGAELTFKSPPTPLKGGFKEERVSSDSLSEKFSSDFEPPFRGAGGLLTVFTTRIDTIFGVSYLVLAPESELVEDLLTPECREEAEKYINQAKNRSDRDRQADVKTVSGAFTGSYTINPFNGEKIPVWIADYVLAGYGTGVVMGVPCSDDRDFRFAQHFNLPVPCVIEGTEHLENPTEIKRGKLINSGFLTGLETDEAIQKAITFAEEKGIGKGKVNYRLRDAIFARQRYWGEPIPVFYKDEMPYTLPETELPLLLPDIDKYLPTEAGDPPLARAENWAYEGNPLEINTMPGWAGSSWYWYRYMDAHNENAFASREAMDYWQDVDLYMGGAEHATGHLLYSRFWNHFLYDLGLVPKKEFARKLINQGMIQGRSSLVYRLKSSEGRKPVFISKNLLDSQEVTEIHVDVNLVEIDELDIQRFCQWRPDLADAEFVLENGKYICGFQAEKMSKRLYNVVNPDDVVERYGADTLRLFEMFLGPLEQSKPWDTRSIDGCFKFLRKLWRLFYDENGKWLVKDEAAMSAELKSLHKTIKKAEEDIEKHSFNTVVSTLMICVNELKDLGCSKKAILEDLLVVLSPFAPHIAEELWEKLGYAASITQAEYPVWNADFIREAEFEYPVSINGKVRVKMTFGLDTPASDIETAVLASETVQRWLEGKPPKKVIVVQKKIVNVVV
jgi:leucyl-tRNA synthetase